MSDNASKRLFFALWPDAATRAAIAACRDALKGTRPARWVGIDNLHLTLVFLGDVPSGELLAVRRIGKAVRSSCFDLSFDRMETWVRPGVLSLVGSGGGEAAVSLARLLANGLSSSGFVTDARRSRPHVTVARKVVGAGAPEILAKPVVWPVLSFCLVQSFLGPAGPRYDVLDTWGLLDPKAMSDRPDMR